MRCAQHHGGIAPARLPHALWRRVRLARLQALGRVAQIGTLPLPQCELAHSGALDDVAPFVELARTPQLQDWLSYASIEARSYSQDRLHQYGVGTISSGIRR
jgi:hypothetical protein